MIHALHRFVRAEPGQGRKIRNGQPAPRRSKDPHAPQLGQFPCEMDPADSKDVRKVLLVHLNDKAGICRLVHGQQVQQVAQLDPGGVELLVDRFKEKPVDIYGIPVDHLFRQGCIGFKHSPELRDRKLQYADLRQRRHGQGQLDPEIRGMIAWEHGPGAVKADDPAPAGLMLRKMDRRAGEKVV